LGKAVQNYYLGRVGGDYGYFVFQLATSKTEQSFRTALSFNYLGFIKKVFGVYFFS